MHQGPEDTVQRGHTPTFPLGWSLESVRAVVTNRILAVWRPWADGHRLCPCPIRGSQQCVSTVFAAPSHILSVVPWFSYLHPLDMGATPGPVLRALSQWPVSWHQMPPTAPHTALTRPLSPMWPPRHCQPCSPAPALVVTTASGVLSLTPSDPRNQWAPPSASPALPARWCAL